MSKHSQPRDEEHTHDSAFKEAQEHAKKAVRLHHKVGKAIKDGQEDTLGGVNDQIPAPGPFSGDEEN